MSSYEHPAAPRGKFHYCDNCETDDGRKTLVWVDKDFALCLECLESLCRQHIDPDLKAGESIVVKRAVIPEAVRSAIYERDGYKCVFCGSAEYLCLDHITPFARGGKTSPDNLRTLCRSCNLKRRGDRG